MNVKNLFAKVAGRQQARQQQRIVAYRDLVAAVATGKEIDPQRIETALAEFGKSLPELESAVDLYLKRFAWKAMIAMQPKLEAEQQQLRFQVAEADRQLQAAEDQHTDVTHPLYQRLEAIKTALSDGSNARRELYDSCPDDSLGRQLEEIAQECRQIDERVANLNSQIAHMELKATNTEQSANRETTEESRIGRQELAQQFRNDAMQSKRKIRELEKQQQELHHRRDAVEQQMRDW